MKKKNKDVKVGYYVVAFMDVLGQQELLRSFETFDELTESEIIDTLKKTYGVITGVRKLIYSFFEAYSSRRRNDLPVPHEKKALVKTLKSHPIRINQFSDFVLAFFSLRDTHDCQLPVAGIHAIFGAAASASIAGLATKNPIRGGIDIGWGVEVKHNEVYGGGLAKAYALESKLADYPRVIVGNDLVSYLKGLSERSPSTKIQLINTEIAKTCLGMLVKEEGDYYQIDFLGEYSKQLGIDNMQDDVREAFCYVSDQVEKHRSNQNTELTKRYERLLAYFQSNASRWGNYA